MLNIKNVLIIALIAFASYFVGYWSKPVETKETVFSGSFASANDSISISSLLSESEIVAHGSEMEADDELKDYLFDYICQDLGDVCDDSNRILELNLEAVDLNSDGIDEYIAMPFTVSETSIRGASGGGPILIIEKQREKPEVIGEMLGNSYIVLNQKENGYYKLLIHNHSSSSSGTETLHQMSKDDGFGIEKRGYYEVLTKWYRKY